MSNEPSHCPKLLQATTAHGPKAVNREAQLMLTYTAAEAGK